MRILFLALAGLLLSGLLTHNPSAFAQRAESGGTGTAAWKLAKKPMNLPDLPSYSGKATFTNGLMYPNKPGGPAINLMYKAKEPPEQVMSWYQDTLKGNSWSVVPTKNPNSLRANKGKNGVVVNVSPSKTPGYSTELKISYKLAR